MGENFWEICYKYSERITSGKKNGKNYLRMVHYLVNNELFSHFMVNNINNNNTKKTNSWEKYFKHPGLLKTENEYC